MKTNLPLLPNNLPLLPSKSECVRQEQTGRI